LAGSPRGTTLTAEEAAEEADRTTEEGVHLTRVTVEAGVVTKGTRVLRGTRILMDGSQVGGVVNRTPGMSSAHHQQEVATNHEVLAIPTRSEVLVATPTRSGATTTGFRTSTMTGPAVVVASTADLAVQRARM